MAARRLPARPDLHHLERQAKDLLRAFREGVPAAVSEFRDYHPERIVAETAKLSDAQLVLARSYGAHSWPALVAICVLIAAIQRDDVEAIRHHSLAHAELAHQRATAPDTAWGVVIAQAANESLRRIVTRLRGMGDMSSAAARPEMRPWMETLRLLGRWGGRFPKEAIGGAVESLAASDFAFMVETGTEIADERGDWRSRLALALETYARHPQGKHAILETMVAQGIPLPDTPTMAVHRGRLDLLDQWLQRDPELLERTFSHEEIFPPELGCHADESLALVGAARWRDVATHGGGL